MKLRAQYGIGLAKADAGLEAAHHLDPIKVLVNESGIDIVVAIQIHKAEIVNRNEHDRRALRSNAEKFRMRDAGNDERPAVNENGFADGAIARSEAPLRKTVGDCDDGCGAGPVVVGSDQPACSGPNTQRAEIIAGDILTFAKLGLAVHNEVETPCGRVAE